MEEKTEERKRLELGFIKMIESCGKYRCVCVYIYIYTRDRSNEKREQWNDSSSTKSLARLSHPGTENSFVTFVTQFPNLSAVDGTINHRRHLQNVKRKEEEEEESAGTDSEVRKYESFDSVGIHWTKFPLVENLSYDNRRIIDEFLLLLTSSL